jgi:hypothetical protein
MEAKKFVVRKILKGLKEIKEREIHAYSFEC